MKKIKLGFIGGGRHAEPAHIQKMLSIEEVEIVGCFDPDVKVFERVEKNYGFKMKSFANEKELLKNCDAVIISSPDEFHFQQLKTAVEMGVHTLVEKPVCTKAEELTALEVLMSENPDVVITTCYPRRFDLPYIMAEKYLDTQDYGKILKVELTLRKKQNVNPETYDNSALQDHLCHEIDIMSYICGGYSPFVMHKLVDGPYRYEVAGVRDDGISFSFANQYFLDDAKDNLEEIKIYLEKEVITLTSVGGSNEFKVYLGDKFLMTWSRDMNRAYLDVNKSFVYSVLGKFPTYVSRKELSVSASVILMKLTDTLKF
ncbi:MAG: Gfo/Idh/MocA family oxidoreductase [Alphaproteobacteria bacterium]